MAEIYQQVVSDGENDHPQSPSFNIAMDDKDNEWKCRKMNLIIHDCVDNKNNHTEGESSYSLDDDKEQQRQLQQKRVVKSVGIMKATPKFGVAAVCGHRRHMEDTIAIHPWLVNPELHYFAVYDGHGCSHISKKCRERLHELVKEELSLNNNNKEPLVEWQLTMEKSFAKMDEEAIGCLNGVVGKCRCQVQTPLFNSVGSTAVVAILTPHQIIVANCGDSRAVLCRNGRAIPLSTDHKPDRPDELNRIQEAGGRVTYLDCPRVLGMLNMSRAIGDIHLKPYVSCEPEVTITDRTSEDECLILASDGLWDVVSNDTACGVARMCLRGNELPLEAELLLPAVDIVGVDGIITVDKACNDASILLTKLALARNTEDNISVVVVDLHKKIFQK